MRFSQAGSLVLILALGSCRLWRPEPDHRSVRSGHVPQADDGPIPSSGPDGDVPAPPHPGEPAPGDAGPPSGPILLDYQSTRDRLDLSAVKKRLSFNSVSSTMILEAFQKTAAGHPRIIANRDDFARIRQALSQQDPYVRAAIESLKKSAENYLKAPLAPYQLDDANLRLTAGHSTQEAIAVLSFLYQVTGHRPYADKVKEHLLHYAGFQDWNDAKHFLDTGIMSYSVALGYDWTYDNLSASERDSISRALMDKGMRRYLERATPSAFWYQSQNNWNPICNGGVSLAAMAVMDKSSEARTLALEVLTRALQGVPHYIREFEPDGQTVEGMMYWDYGLANFIRWMETMKRTLGTDFAYTDTPGLRAAGFFPLAVSGPVTGISLGDDPLKKVRSSSGFWFAKRYNLPSLAQYHREEVRHYRKYGWMDLLFYEPRLLSAGAAPAASLPLDRYVRDLDYISFRSSWDHAEALYVGIHAGDNKASHGHLDAGTFFVQGAGEVWAIGGLGGDNYTFPGYFSKETKPAYTSANMGISEAGRFHMYRLRAEGKNTLVLNPDARPDQNPDGRADVERILSRDTDAIAIMNLSGVYDRDAQRVRRGLGLRDKRQIVTIQDEIKMKAPGSIWWSMHTTASVELQQNGRVAILRQGGRNLWMEIQSPASASFAWRDANYLPGLSFPLSQNSPNSFQGVPVKKLTISLPKISETTLSVSMKLMPDTRVIPQLPAPTRLDDWIQAFPAP
jgi:hypothetical protein